MKTILFHTQGCRLNQAETASLEQQFEQKGFKAVKNTKEADIALVNTCTVTENGDTDTKRLVRKLSSENPNIKIALIGCQSQILKEKLLSLQNVHWVIGNAEKMNAANLISTHTDIKPLLSVEKIKREPFTLNSAKKDNKHTRANLKIQDGCDFYCSFCVIPFARGPARSRVFEDLIREAIDLVDRGHKEIVLTGINLGTYSYEEKDLTAVIQALSHIKGLHRIRISSIEPTTIPQTVIEELKTNPLCCNYLHIPLQSGSQEILEKMDRKYNLKEFREFVSMVEKEIPKICIGTDIIVGFPGETKAHFDETMATFLTSPLHYAHVFSYSERSFARSKKLDFQVPATEIAKRSEALRKASLKKHQTFLDQFIGSTLEVLVEQEKQGLWNGLSSNYCRIKFNSDKKNLKNELIEIKIEKREGQSLIGIPI